MKDGEAKHRRLVELVTIENCLNLYKTGTVQRHIAETEDAKTEKKEGTPRIHGVVFDPADGILRRLPWEKALSEMGDLGVIYNLY